MDLSEHLEDRIVDYFLRAQVDTQPTSVKVALWQSDPGDAAAPAGNEVTGGSYPTGGVTITFAAPTSGLTQSAANVIFPTATTDWDPATHVVIFDNLGNFFMKGAISPSVTILSGQTLTIPAGNLQVTID